MVWSNLKKLFLFKEYLFLLLFILFHRFFIIELTFALYYLITDNQKIRNLIAKTIKETFFNNNNQISYTKLHERSVELNFFHSCYRYRYIFNSSQLLTRRNVRTDEQCSRISHPIEYSTEQNSSLEIPFGQKPRQKSRQLVRKNSLLSPPSTPSPKIMQEICGHRAHVICPHLSRTRVTCYSGAKRLFHLSFEPCTTLQVH